MREPFTYEQKDAMGPTRFSGHVWFYFNEWDFVITAPPKCGSSSIKQYVWMHEIDDRVSTPLHSDVKKMHCDKFAVVRNPLDRFASLWKSKCRDKMPVRNNAVHGMSPRALMEHIASGGRDVHWTPQYKLSKGLDVKLIALPNLNSWWAANGYGELGVFNKTSGTMEMDETIREWIRDFYAEDYELYTKALNSFELVLPTANV